MGAGYNPQRLHPHIVTPWRGTPVDVGKRRYRPQIISATARTIGHTQCRYRPQVNKN